eukprot:scaffold2903_cov170-Amphora_coffeaeformis.AAC.3
MANPSREITRSASETTVGGKADMKGDQSSENHCQLLSSRSSHSPSTSGRKSLLEAFQQHGSRRNLFQRATSLKRIHEKTDDSKTETVHQQPQLVLSRRTLTSHGSRRKLLSRATCTGNSEEATENRRRLMKRGQSDEGNLGPSSSSDHIRSIAPTISRVSSDRRLVMKRGQSERGLPHASSSSDYNIRSIAPTISRLSSDKRLGRTSSDRRLQMTRTSSVSKMFCRSKKNSSQHSQDEDKTDSLMAEMLASSRHSTHTSPDSSSKLNGSSQSFFSRTPSRRDLFGSSQNNSMRNLFSIPTSTSDRKVSFFDKDSDECIKTETFLYEGTTEDEKVFVYDGRPEQEVFKSTKWLASCKLVPGSGVYKQAVDVVYEEEWKKSSSQKRAIELSKDIDIIVSSDLRGLEEVYSPAVQRHRKNIVSKVVAAYQANPKLAGQHRLAKLASELSARSVQIAHLLALGDAKEVYLYLSK